MKRVSASNVSSQCCVELFPCPSLSVENSVIDLGIFNLLCVYGAERHSVVQIIILIGIYYLLDLPPGVWEQCVKTE